MRGRILSTSGGAYPWWRVVTSTGRLVPAVDYLQAQRMRMMMMMELAKATSHVDVYIAASNNTGVGGPGGPGGRGPGAKHQFHRCATLAGELVGDLRQCEVEIRRCSNHRSALRAHV